MLMINKGDVHSCRSSHSQRPTTTITTMATPSGSQPVPGPSSINADYYAPTPAAAAPAATAFTATTTPLQHPISHHPSPYYAAPAGYIPNPNATPEHPYIPAHPPVVVPVPRRNRRRLCWIMIGCTVFWAAIVIAIVVAWIVLKARNRK